MNCLMIKMMIMTCKYYADFEGVCCNGDCKPHVADCCPYERQETCKYYEETEAKDADAGETD